MPYTITPNMNLVVPTVGNEPGPTYAQDINTSMSLVDQHDHTLGHGVQITPAGMNINADLPINSNNLTLVNSLELISQSASLSIARSIYSVLGDLWYSNSSGIAIQLTSGNSVVGAPGTISGLNSPASATYDIPSQTFVWKANVSIPANMDAASLIIRYPGSYPSPSGNYIALEAPSSLSTGLAFTLPGSYPSGSTQVIEMSTSGVMSFITYDSIGQSMSSVGANAVAASRTRAVSTTVGLGGVAISANTTSVTALSGTPVLITNSSITITTSGRPVFIGLNSIGNSSSKIELYSASSGLNTLTGTVYIYRGGSPWAQNNVGIQGNNTGTLSVSLPASSVSFIDTPAAGTYTYTAYIAGDTNSIMVATNCILIAYEL